MIEPNSLIAHKVLLAWLDEIARVRDVLQTIEPSPAVREATQRLNSLLNRVNVQVVYPQEGSRDAVPKDPTTQ